MFFRHPCCHCGHARCATYAPKTHVRRADMCFRHIFRAPGVPRQTYGPRIAKHIYNTCPVVGNCFRHHCCRSGRLCFSRDARCSPETSRKQKNKGPNKGRVARGLPEHGLLEGLCCDASGRLEASSGPQRGLFGAAIGLVGAPGVRNICLTHMSDGRVFGTYFGHLVSRDSHRCPEWQQRYPKHMSDRRTYVF